MRLGDEHGEYLHAMYLNNFGATVAGRELSAFPKGMGDPRLRVEDSVLVGTLDVTSERVATATMGYKQRPLDEDEARAVLYAGADKISVNSPALERPALIDELAAAFGVAACCALP